MEVFWFCAIAVMIVLYVVLDGFDLGAGVLHLCLARNEEERQQIYRSIGPVWDGNEVWLLAGGGTLYLAFPKLYASSFSGFYLPLMIVLWLLVVRGISIELRNHLTGPIWRPFWDAGFGLSSVLLTIFFGAALGNVVRGVPLEESGYFFLPLWTNFGFGQQGLGGAGGILDWYTILVAVLALVTLTLHSCKWIALKTTGSLFEKASRLASYLWWVTLVLVVLVTAASFMVQPHLAESFFSRPWGALFPILALLGLAGIRFSDDERESLRGFLASCLFIVGMLTSAAFGLFPYVLPSLSEGSSGLTIYNSAATGSSLRVALYWWFPGMVLVAAYFIYSYRHLAGKVE